MKFMDINQKRERYKKNTFICSIILYSFMMLGGCGKETQQTMAENTQEEIQDTTSSEIIKNSIADNIQ